MLELLGLKYIPFFAQFMVVIVNGQISCLALQHAVVAQKLEHVHVQTQYQTSLVRIVHSLEKLLKHCHVIHNHVQVSISWYVYCLVYYFE